MTAIGGVWSFASGVDPFKGCERVLDAQQAYGPENPAIWRGNDIALGSRQYLLLPEDGLGGSTIVSDDESFILAGDVRLDNRRDLVDQLGIPVGKAALLTDAALMAKSFERWGSAALPRFSGDFAVALWDRRRSKLSLARDFAGQRPLHFHRGNGFVAFASMPNGLHALAQVPKAPDPEKLVDFLALLPESDARSHYADIGKVPPGALVVLTPDATRTEIFWNPSLEPILLTDAGAYEEALRDKLDKSVSARLRGSGGTVAAHLSAGLDSASVATTAARLLLPHGGRVVAFTSVPRGDVTAGSLGGRIADEGPLAAATAGMHSNLDHVRIPLSPDLPLDAIERHHRLYQRPILNLTNFIWLDQIKSAARDRGLRVMLTGARGNMSLSYHGWALLSSLARSGRLWRLRSELERLREKGAPWRTILSRTVGPFLPEAIWGLIAALRGPQHRAKGWSMLSKAPWVQAYLEERKMQLGHQIKRKPIFDSIEARLTILGGVDYGNYNKGTLAGWGIDTRDPTSDRELVEFCLRVPEEQYLRNGVVRSLAKRAMSDRIPDIVLNERRKGHQAAHWYVDFSRGRDQLAEEIARISECGSNVDFLDVNFMCALLDDWPSSGWDHPEHVGTYRLALMRGIAAGTFARKAYASEA